MDPLIISSKFDEINKKIEKLETDNRLLRSELTSLRKIISNRVSTEQILQEKVFVSHKKHIELLSKTIIPKLNLDEFVNSIQISREHLLKCIENFDSGICNILDNIINNEFPIVSMAFSKKKHLYVYNNYNWNICHDNILVDFLTKFIQGPLFREFTDWQKENKESLKSISLSSKYHEILLLMMNTPKNVMYNFKKYLITKIGCIN